MPVLHRNSNEGRPVDLNTLIAPIVAEPQEEVPMEVQEEALAEPHEEVPMEVQEEVPAEPQEVPMEIDDPPSHCLTGCMLCNAIGFYDCNDCLE